MFMQSSYTYRAAGTWSGGRTGHIHPEQFNPQQITFSPPPEFGGEDGRWTPEHLFVAAIGSCFLSTFRAIAGMSKLPVVGVELEIEGELTKGEHGYSFTRVVLRPQIALESLEHSERAQRVVEKAERACFVTQSITAKVEVEATVVAATPAGVGG
jgi:organic hydroperoxide reductase OsmC/OhrA